MTFNTKPIAKMKDIVVRDSENEILIYDPESNKAFNLNETTSQIWKMCDGKKTISEISSDLSKKWNTPVSDKVLDEAKKRFPNEKIKAVITTSDAFPHFGGVREYAAQNIPIYVLDANRSIIEKVLSAPHKFYPDSLERNSCKANLKAISGKTNLGSGANRMEIHPFRTETGERMLMIYFPEHNLLYSSDLIQYLEKDVFFAPQYLSEVIDAVKREDLTVEYVFGMHLDKTAWSDVTKFVAEHTAGNSQQK